MLAQLTNDLRILAEARKLLVSFRLGLALVFDLKRYPVFPICIEKFMQLLWLVLEMGDGADDNQ